LLLHNEIFPIHPSTTPTSVKAVSHSLTQDRRPAELDPPPVRPRQVAFKFCDIFLPLCSCSSSCSLVSISHKSHQTATVRTATNFPPKSFQSRDCCQPHFSSHDLPTDVATKVNSQYRMQYGYRDVIYGRHRYLFRHTITFSMQFMSSQF